MGLICLIGSLCRCLCRCLSYPGLRPISRPCDLCPELVRSRAWKRSKALALQAKTHLIKTIMGLYMCPVVGRLLANQMLQILLRIKQSGWTSLMRWRRVHGLWCITLDLPLRAVLLNKSLGDRRLNHLARCDGTPNDWQSPVIKAGNPRALLDLSESRGCLVGAIPANI